MKQARDSNLKYDRKKPFTYTVMQTKGHYFEIRTGFSVFFFFILKEHNAGK